MEDFHRQIADLQKEEGVRVISRAHMLGFLDPDLPKHGEGGSAAPRAMSEQMAASPPQF